MWPRSRLISQQRSIFIIFFWYINNIWSTFTLLTNTALFRLLDLCFLAFGSSFHSRDTSQHNRGGESQNYEYERSQQRVVQGAIICVQLVDQDGQVLQIVHGSVHNLIAVKKSKKKSAFYYNSKLKFTHNGDGGTGTLSGDVFLYHSCANLTKDFISYFPTS